MSLHAVEKGGKERRGLLIKCVRMGVKLGPHQIVISANLQPPQTHCVHTLCLHTQAHVHSCVCVCVYVHMYPKPKLKQYQKERKKVSECEALVLLISVPKYLINK